MKGANKVKANDRLEKKICTLSNIQMININFYVKKCWDKILIIELIPFPSLLSHFSEATQYHELDIPF